MTTTSTNDHTSGAAPQALNQARLDASLTETPLNADTLSQSDVSSAEEKGKTVLYLAYGSNMCEETFRGARGIKPISQVNVLVPSLRLTFDLPGVPYTEPCFANTAVRRTADAPDSYASSVGSADYHKDRWHKGLVGCVYEVTPSDYAHIIATEGGGSAYQDILVDCHVLPASDTVPATPSGPAFKAHTLFAPYVDPASPPRDPDTAPSDRASRPDPSYAQPSARYLKLLVDGAAELELPGEYREYLGQIRAYTITNAKQRVGKAMFLAVWVPLIMFIFSLGDKFKDEKGKAPKWLAKMSAAVFQGMWTSYDAVFKRLFGDGERTEGLDDEEDEGEEKGKDMYTMD
ncbi:gliotoxin biosynthesis protein GliK [Corynespora cassiicola Philippines]|uniref:gamma-glutamylcyclotransferase n=1 Tax=Corynespora cassiicola Philippines TaxID=1448308 RepID=A0A2T2N556_CORCC|nr:gliotoxin biosynthesis protein GliK [Corynespora cassiicola Philippines]